MATQVQFRRGTTAQNNSFTGALGEVTVDTDKDTLVVHDGGTAGGFEISRADASNLKFPDGSVGSPAISFASDTNTGIYRGGTDILKFVTAGTDAITIDASQQVGIGVSPTHALTVQYNGGVTTAKFQNTNTSGTSIDSATLTLSSTSRDASVNITSNSSRSSVLNFGDEINSARGRLIYDNSDDSLEIQTSALQRLNISSGGDISFYEDTGSTPKLFWDASAERLGIGTSSPDELLHLKSNSNAYKMLKLEADTAGGDAGILLQGQNGNQFEIHQPYDSAGLFFYDRTNGTERMRIDSSGNLLVGKTTLDYDTPTGHVLRADGFYSSVRSGGNCVDFNRLSSDGEIIRVSKDGADVGSIGSVSGSSIYIEGKDFRSGLFFGDGVIAPRYNHASSNGTQNLGGASERFANLYLSGGVYLGGTGSANLLDDYEEGTFEATVVPEISGTITIGTNVDKLSYTKIGRKVTIIGLLGVASVSSPVGAYVAVTNLPFTSADLAEISGRASVNISFKDNTIATTNSDRINPEGAIIVEGATEFRIYRDASTIAVSDDIFISLTYFTA